MSRSAGSKWRWQGRGKKGGGGEERSDLELGGDRDQIVRPEARRLTAGRGWITRSSIHPTAEIIAVLCPVVRSKRGNPQHAAVERSLESAGCGGGGWERKERHLVERHTEMSGLRKHVHHSTGAFFDIDREENARAIRVARCR